MLHVFMVSIFYFKASCEFLWCLTRLTAMGTEDISTPVGDKVSSVASAWYKSWDSIVDTKL